jgi:uncharacterized RDD family membrane protein YckC
LCWPELAIASCTIIGDGAVRECTWTAQKQFQNFKLTPFAVGRTAEVFGFPSDVAGGLAMGAAATYYLFSDALPNGQSLGKKLLGMSVIDERSYLGCNLFQSFMRNITTPFLSVLDWIFIFFGSRKRLGDMLASTVVIRSR